MNLDPTEMTHQSPVQPRPGDQQANHPMQLREQPKKSDAQEVIHVETASSEIETCQYDCDRNSRGINNEGSSLQGRKSSSASEVVDVSEEEEEAMGEENQLGEENGRERLKRHRIEVAGRIWIPEIWGQEELLKDWMDCSAFDASLVPSGIMSARAALVEEGRTSSSGRFRIENRC